MKNIRLSILFACIALVFTACQKDLSFEAGLAKGSLKKDLTTGACEAFTVNGSYQKDTVLKPAVNFVDVQIDISVIGSYSIKTDTINGYSFSGSGVASIVGLNTVRLVAAGKPLAPSVDVFSIKFDTSVCQFDVVVSGTGGGGGANIYTFECPTNPTFSGTYQAGTSTAGNSVKINVISANGGSYSITTTNSNGISFSGSGVLLASPNPQSVTLFAAGIPSAGGNFTYTLSGSGTTSTCTFIQTFGGSAMVSSDSIVATIDGVYKTFKIRDTAQLDNTSIPGYSAIGIYGDNNAAGDEAFTLVVAKMGAAVTPGTYTVNQGPATIVAADYATPTSDYSTFTGTSPQTPGFTITITSITSTRVIGTFSGRILEMSGAGPAFKTVTNGIFSVTIYP